LSYFIWEITFRGYVLLCSSSCIVPWLILSISVLTDLWCQVNVVTWLNALVMMTYQLTAAIGIAAQSILGGYKNQQNSQILHDSCPKKISKYPNFYDICLKNLQSAQILHDFCQKNARILHNCPKNIFFPDFRGHVPSVPPTPMTAAALISPCQSKLLQDLLWADLTVIVVYMYITVFELGLYWISALANLESGHFSEIWPTGLGQISSQLWQIPVQLHYAIQLWIKMTHMTCKIVNT